MKHGYESAPVDWRASDNVPIATEIMDGLRHESGDYPEFLLIELLESFKQSIDDANVDKIIAVLHDAIVSREQTNPIENNQNETEESSLGVHVNSVVDQREQGVNQQINVSGGIHADKGFVNLAKLLVNGDFVTGNKIIMGLSYSQVMSLFEKLLKDRQLRKWKGKEPYIGLDSFDEDNQFFFGRETLIEEILGKLRVSCFVCIAGPSGSGKSSLARAGVLRALNQTGQQHSNRWFTTSMRPQISPIEMLAAAMRHLVASKLEQLALSTQIEEEISTHGSPNGDGEFCEEILHKCVELILTPSAEDQRCVILVDQLEEIFSASVRTEERNAFLAILSYAANHQNGRTIILTTVRTEFLAKCKTHESLEFLVTRKNITLVVPMEPAELARAIALPAINANVTLDPELIEVLRIHMRGNEHALPLMQFTLKALFDRTPKEINEPVIIKYQQYLDAGDITTIFEQHLIIAQKLLADKLQLSNVVQNKLLEFIFSHLVEKNDASQYTRRIAHFTELTPNDTPESVVRDLVDILASPKLRLLTIDGEHVMLAHDMLIVTWPFLDQLTTKLSQGQTIHLGISNDAKKWLKSDVKNKKSYLYLGAKLSATEDLIKTYDIRLNSLSQGFLEASQHEEKRRRLWAFIIRVSAVALLTIIAIALYFAGKFEYDSRMNTLTGSSELLANNAEQFLTLFPIKAIEDSLQALPADENERPYVPEAEYSLTEALRLIHDDQYHRISAQPLDPSTVAQFSEGKEYRFVTGGDNLHLIGKDSTPIQLQTQLTHTIHLQTSLTDLFLAYEYSSTSLDESIIEIWRGEQFEERFTITGTITCATWHPHKGQVAICTENHVWIWSAPWTDGPKSLPFDDQELMDDFEFLEWSADGNRLAAVTYYPEVLVWDMQPDTPVQLQYMPEPHFAPISDVAWTPDEHFLATASTDGEISIWQVDDLEEPFISTIEVCATSDDNYDIETGVRFLDDERLATWSSTGSIRIWDLEGQPLVPEGLTLHCITDPAAPTIQEVFWFDNAHLLIARSDGTAQLQPSIQEEGYFIAGHERSITAAAFSPETEDISTDRYLATADRDGVIQIWDTASKRTVMALRRHDEPVDGRADVLAVAWEDAHSLLSIGKDGTARRWSVIDENQMPICQGEDERGIPICMDPGGSIVAHEAKIDQIRWIDGDSRFGTISLKDDIAKIWTHEQGNSPFGHTMRQDGPDYQLSDLASFQEVQSAYWITRGQLLISDEFGTVEIVNPEQNSLLTALQDHESHITSISHHVDGRLATGDVMGSVHVWDKEFNPEWGSAALAGAGKDPESAQKLEWASDGSYLLGHSNKTIVLWDAETGKLIWSWPGDADVRVSKVHASLAADHVVIAYDKTMLVWNRTSKEEIWRLDESMHEESLLGVKWVSGVAWPYQPTDYLNLIGMTLDASRQLIFAWDGDGRVQLWDWQANAEILRLTEPRDDDNEVIPIAQFDVSDSGHSILTVAQNSNMIRVWNAWHTRPHQLLSEAEAIRKP
ncbi:MAG: AAA family ATPase [Chloroflexota bacterium]